MGARGLSVSPSTPPKGEFIPMKNNKHFPVRALLCAVLACLLLPFAAFPAMAEGEEPYNFAIGQQIHCDNSYVPPEGFFDVAFLVDGEWLTYDGANVKLGWNTDPFIFIGDDDPVEIVISLDTYYLLDKIVICPMKWANGVAFPRGYELLGSLNGTDWFEVYAPQSDLNAEAADNLSVQPKEYVLDAPVSIRYFMLRITKQSAVVDATGANTSALGEIELYGVKDTAAAEAAVKALAEAKNAAKSELEAYRAEKADADYREAQVAELNAALTAGLEKIEAATDEAAVASAVANAKKALDAVKTDAQLTEEEATEAPTEAPTEPETEPDTEAPTEEATEAPAEETTEAPAEETTAAPTDDGYGETQPTFPGETVPTETKGCGSVMGVGAAAVLCAMAAAVALRKKD